MSDLYLYLINNNDAYQKCVWYFPNYLRNGRYILILNKLLRKIILKRLDSFICIPMSNYIQRFDNIIIEFNLI